MPGTVVQPSLSGHQTQQRYGAGIDGTMKFGQARVGERLAAAAGRDLRRQCAAILGTVRRPEPGRRLLADAGVVRTLGRWK
jgi:hypothetical protein